VEIARPRVRSRDGGELALPSWKAALGEGFLEQWAMNLMLINVSTRCIARAVRLPEGDLGAPAGAGLTKSAVSRRFVALSAARMAAWMSSDFSDLDLLAIQIDGLHIKQELVMVAAVGIDAQGIKHPLAVREAATENAAVVQALLDNLIERGLDPTVCRLFIIDGAKALKKAIRATSGRHTPIQRCQIHKACNILERLPKALHASVREGLRQAWELDDAEKAKTLLLNIARCLEQEVPGVAGSLVEGLDEILTVTRLGLPQELRRSLACTNIIENMMARSAGSAPTSNAGAMPPWRCAGRRLACSRRKRASAASRPTSSSRSCAPHCKRIRPSTPTTTLKPHQRLHSL
jgi:hypothetical protein